MIDQYNDDRTGWARFSDDMTMRFRLARSLRGQKLHCATCGDTGTDLQRGDPRPCTCGMVRPRVRVVFLLLNPSDADAFAPDPTVTECRKRATALGADVLEVVNLFAWRSPYPTDLKKRAHGERGDGPDNNHQIIEACTGAYMVIAGWGNDGDIGQRDRFVRNLLQVAGVPLYHLGTTRGGFPKHPLARGKHRIPADLQPVLWS